MVAFEAGLTDQKSSTLQLDLHQAASRLEKTLQVKLFYRLEWLAGNFWLEKAWLC